MQASSVVMFLIHSICDLGMSMLMTCVASIHGMADVIEHSSAGFSLSAIPLWPASNLDFGSFHFLHDLMD